MLAQDSEHQVADHSLDVNQQGISMDQITYWKNTVQHMKNWLWFIQSIFFLLKQTIAASVADP